MLNPGTRLGPYELQSLVGAGGMGEVYKALDTRLERAVAIKVLPQALAADPAFRERFEREARIVSQLSHPHICALYDIGSATVPLGDGPTTASASYLVMEFLEGETLATRLERGALKPEEALAIAGEIGEALDRAHEAGVVHRDLKPGNVMLTRAGAKLLDFGLAKKAAAAVASRGGAVVPIATSSAVTAEGLIVGTFQYMAPEQLEGVEPDARTDIFAFGAILYEMLTGRKAFEGKTPVSLIGAILKDDPPPVSAVVPVAPAALDRIIRACLAKDPDARLSSAHDLVLQLRWIAEGGDRPPAAPAPTPAPRVDRRSPSRATVLAGAVAAAVVALAVGIAVGRRSGEEPAPAATYQFTVAPPENSVLGGANVPSFAVSPDGRQVVFVATIPGSAAVGSNMLFRRSLDSLAVTPMPGTDRATYPFWSPDSRFVAFFAAGKLKKVQMQDGSVSDLADAPAGRGGTWSQDDVIVFAPADGRPLARVAATGGATATTPATALATAPADTSHRWPYFLPDGRHFLYQAVGDTRRPSEVRVGSLDAIADASTVVTTESMATYASGHVLFWRDGNLVAQPFDTTTFKVSGDAVRVAGPIGMQVGVGYASFATSPAGVLVHARGNTRPTSRLTWVDRTGKQTGIGESGDYLNLSLAPDGKRAAVTLVKGIPENRDIWIIDLDRPTVQSRLTTDAADDRLPHWSSDGTKVVFGSLRDGQSRLYVKNVDGGGPEEQLANLGDGNPNPLDWSSDGRFVLFFKQLPKTNFGLWLQPLEGDTKASAFEDTNFNETDGAFSPDMKWVAYTSDESGREEVYVRSFPAAGQKFRVSTTGGNAPVWRGDGRELYFLAPDSTMMAAPISAPAGGAPGVHVGEPTPLFPSGVAFTGNRHQYAVTKDGQRFLVNVTTQGAGPAPLTVVVNWPAALQR